MVVRISVAGQVAIEVDGAQIDVNGLGRVGRLYLAYLVCERRRPVTKDELAEVLWGDAELPRSWEQMLRGNASKVRTILAASGLDAAGALTSAFGAQQLRLPPDVVVDVEEGGFALERALADLRAGRADEAFDAATAAVTVASRGFLPGWSGAWVERRQAELRELHLGALEVVGQAACARRRWADGVAAAEEVAAIEPFRESAYQILMAAHRGAGNTGEALRAYERCRRVLAEDLGVGPSPVTENAYLSLISDRPETDGTGLQLPLPASLAPTAAAFLVGRQSETNHLSAALERVSTEGPQAVLVGGEPGIGKTALVADFARAAYASGVSVLYGRCDEELGIAYQPFAEALGHYIAHCPLGELTAQVAIHGAELSRIAPELERRLPDAPPPVVSGSEGDRYRLFEAVTGLLGAATEHRTLLLILDDLHWAAPPTLALLRHVMRSHRSPMCLIGTYRHTEVGAEHPLAATFADLRRERGVERFVLEGLDEAGVSAYVERSEGHALDRAGAVLAKALHARTAGNPFFVGEFLRHLTEAHGVYGKAGTWSYYRDAEGLGLPEGVRDVVARRLGRLSAPANGVLTLAAVAGAEFDLGVIERVEGAMPADSALDALDEAVAARVVAEVGSGRYRFAHALVRETIYSTLTATRRARLHHRVGRALASLPDADDHLPALAHHFVEAAPDGAAIEGADYALAAARQAVAKAAWEDAHSFVRLGLGVLSPSEVEHLKRRYELLLVEAEARLIQIENARAAQAMLEAADAARAIGSPERVATVLSLHLLMIGPWDSTTTREAEATLNQLADAAPGLRARLLAGLAVSSTYRRAGRSDEVSRASLELARRSGDSDALYAALVARTAALADTPHAIERLALEDELLALGPRSGPVAGSRWMYSTGRGRAMALLVLGDRSGFESEAQAVGRRVMIGAAGGHWHLALWRATSALLDGRFADVAELATEARTLIPTAVEQWTVQMAELALALGTARDFASDVERAYTGEPTNSTLGALLAVFHAERGDAHVAQRLVADLVADDFRWTLGEPAPCSTLAYVADAVTILGDPDTAARVYERLLPYTGLSVIDRSAAHCAGAADRYLGQLAAVLHHDEAAEEHFVSALHVETGLRSPPALARTRYWYARMLLRRSVASDVERAGALRETALPIAKALGMARLESQLSALRVT